MRKGDGALCARRCSVCSAWSWSRPAAHAATCAHTGACGTATLTFAPADGTVTLAQDGPGRDLRGRRGCGRWPAEPPRSRTPRRSTPSAAPPRTPSSSTSRPACSYAPTASLRRDRRGARRRGRRLSTCACRRTTTSSQAGRSAPISTATRRPISPGAPPSASRSPASEAPTTSSSAATALLLGGALDIPVALVGGAGDDTLRGGAAADTFAGGPGEDVVTYDDRSAAVSASLNGAGRRRRERRGRSHRHGRRGHHGRVGQRHADGQPARQRARRRRGQRRRLAAAAGRTR